MWAEGGGMISWEFLFLVLLYTTFKGVMKCC
jgi:hypothetical protein